MWGCGGVRGAGFVVLFWSLFWCNFGDLDDVVCLGGVLMSSPGIGIGVVYIVHECR
jgi:hypothetical protein